MTSWRLFLAILACYRLAQLLPLDDGPGEVFKRVRCWTGKRAAAGGWVGLAEFVRCPYCIGVWLALVLAIMVAWPTTAGDVFLTWWGIAGGHTALETMMTPREADS